MFTNKMYVGYEKKIISYKFCMHVLCNSYRIANIE